MFRQFVHNRYLRPLILTIPAVLVPLALAGCAEDDSQARIESLRNDLATVNSENAALRASRRVLQTRLAATQIAARTAGTRLLELNAKLGQLEAHGSTLSRVNAQSAQRLRAAEAAVAHFKGQLTAASRALAASESKNHTLSRELAAVSGWLGQRDALGQSQDNTLKSMEADLQDRARSIESLNQQITRQNNTLQRANAEAKGLRSGNTRLANQLTELQTRLDEISARSARRIAALERQRGELSVRATAARSETQSVQANAQQLSDSNEQFKTRMESLRTELATANDSALRYQVAKDYLVDKVQAQEVEINALKKGAAEARAQHKATVVTMLGQHDELKTAKSASAESLHQARAQNEALQAQIDNLRGQFEQLQLDHTASEQRARGAKQAKDYLDGKLAATAKELDSAREEHRVALLKIEHALRLSLEESRVLQQREREMREQLKLEQQTSSDTIDKLRAELTTSARDLDGLKVRISMFESSLAYLKDGNTKQAATIRGLRDELEARVSATEASLAAAQQATATAQKEMQTCATARKDDSATIRDLKWGNETLLKEIEALEERLRVLEAVQSQCKLQKTAL